jgi:hypothetical protein
MNLIRWLCGRLARRPSLELTERGKRFIRGSRTLRDDLAARQRRQIIFESYGVGSWIADAQDHEIRGELIAEDINLGLPRRLYRLDFVWDSICVLHVINHTFKLSGNEYWRIVPNEMYTPHEAVACSYGFPPEDYKEAVRT